MGQSVERSWLRAVPPEPASGLSPIFHMLPHTAWAGRMSSADYAPLTLAAEGFIHCTAECDRLLAVANAFYRDDTSAYIILVIDPTRVTAEIRWESADGHVFPHIYGSLNPDAVVDVVPFPRSLAGEFLPPTSWPNRKVVHQFNTKPTRDP